MIDNVERNFLLFQLPDCVQRNFGSPEGVIKFGCNDDITGLERSPQPLPFEPIGERYRTGNADLHKKLRNRPTFHHRDSS
ncbi:MAG TPA: hypothetical protein VK522_19200 [Pseudolabrys sp.]|jgi:hypothetical protein|nr:hypothetical protein [Pseudolabrys sp.]